MFFDKPFDQVTIIIVTLLGGDTFEESWIIRDRGLFAQ
jgi:hypothetical protein